MTLSKEYFVIIFLCFLSTILLTSLEVSYILSIQDFLSSAPKTFHVPPKPQKSNFDDIFDKMNDLNEDVPSFEVTEKKLKIVDEDNINKIRIDSVNALQVYVFIIHLPKIDLNQRITREKATIQYLQQISDLEDKISHLNFKIWIQPDFVPYDSHSLQTLFHIGKRFGLKFENEDRFSKISIKTIAKYIKRLYFYETSKKLISEDNKVSCIISIPDINKVKQRHVTDIIENKCLQDSDIFKDIDKIYTLNAYSGALNIIQEHLEFVQEATAGLQYSSFTGGRFEREFSLENQINDLLSSKPIQMQWDFYQVLNKDDTNSKYGRNTEKLSRILYRNAFTKDIDLELLVSCWNKFNLKSKTTKIVFIINEKRHTVDTNGLELSHGDVIQFTVEKF